MSRPLSASFISAFYAQETGAAIPTLFEITHDVAGVTSPLRIVNNPTDLVYEGDTYSAVLAFRFRPPDRREDGTITNATVTFDAVDQSMAALIRSAGEAATIEAIACYVPEVGAFEAAASWAFTMRGVTGNDTTVSAELVWEEILDTMVPGDECRPNLFPGLF